jgi:hypothetical protein
MTPKGEIPGAVKSSMHLLNMALREAQLQGFDCEISERVRESGAQKIMLLDVVVREKGQAYGCHTVSGVHSGLPR